jgi:hypothetical protein
MKLPFLNKVEENKIEIERTKQNSPGFKFTNTNNQTLNNSTVGVHDTLLRKAEENKDEEEEKNEDNKADKQTEVKLQKLKTNNFLTTLKH